MNDRCTDVLSSAVMASLVPAIHEFDRLKPVESWMAWTSLAMTARAAADIVTSGPSPT